MINVDSVSKSFDGTVRSVDNVSFQIGRGERLVLLGPSGCGKTTLLRMINRLVQTDEGSIFVNGKNVVDYNLQELRKDIGYVIQQHGLFPHFTVTQNIAVVPRLLGFSAAKTKDIVHSLMRKLHLDPDKQGELYPSQLSGGQQQRVGLARALAGDPPILLMDEPFGALDPVTRVAIVNDFLQLEELQDKTIVLVTHDVSEAFMLADKICILDKGKVQASGTKQELLFDNNNAFLNTFLAADRFQLELQMTSIANLWDFLPRENNGIEAGISFDPKSSLAVCLEELTKTNNRYFFSSEFDGQVKNISLHGVLEAFSIYKENMYG